MALVSQHLDNAVAVISLHLDNTVFDGTTTATGSPKLLTEGDDGRGVKCQTSNHGDALAGATLGFQGNTHYAIRSWPCAHDAAATTGQRLATLRTHATGFGRVHQAALV